MVSARTPPAHPLLRHLGAGVIRLFRYRMVGEPPVAPVSIVVGAPHTSNWDFILTLSIAYASNLDPVWLGKKEMFVGPAGWIFRKMGGVPVDRSDSGGLVDSMIAVVGSGRHVAVLIAPEGRRDKAKYWKSGFRRIALGADLPVTLSFLDGPTRTGGWGPTLKMSGDVVADMDAIRAFYVDKQGVKPGRFTPPLLREEEDELPTDRSGRKLLGVGGEHEH